VASNWYTPPSTPGGTPPARTIPAKGDDIIFDDAYSPYSCVINVNTAWIESINFSNWTGSLSGATYALTVMGAVTFPPSSSRAATQFYGFTGIFTLYDAGHYLTSSGIYYQIATNGYVLNCNFTIVGGNDTTYEFIDYFRTAKVTHQIGTLIFSGKNSSNTYNASIGSIIMTTLPNPAPGISYYQKIICRSSDDTVKALELNGLLTGGNVLELYNSYIFDIENIYITGNATGARYIKGNTSFNQLKNVFFRHTGTADFGYTTIATAAESTYLGSTSGRFSVVKGSYLKNVYFETNSATSWVSTGTTGNINIYGGTEEEPGVINFGTIAGRLTIPNLVFTSGCYTEVITNSKIIANNDLGTTLNTTFTVAGGYLKFMDEILPSGTNANSAGYGLTNLYIDDGTVELLEDSRFLGIRIGGNSSLNGYADLITHYGKFLKLYYGNDVGKLTIGPYSHINTFNLNCKLTASNGINIISTSKTLNCNDGIAWSGTSSATDTGLLVRGTLNLKKGSIEAATENGDIHVYQYGTLNVGQEVQYPYWSSNHSYSLGDVVIPTTIQTGYYYEASYITGDGMSGSTEPGYWPLGGSFVDNEVTWVAKNFVTEPIGDIRFMDLYTEGNEQIESGSKITIYNNINSHRAINITGGSYVEFNTFAGKELKSSYASASYGLITVSGAGTNITIPANINNRKGLLTSTVGSLTVTGAFTYIASAGDVGSIGSIGADANSTLTIIPPTGYDTFKITSGISTAYGNINMGSSTNPANFIIPGYSGITLPFATITYWPSNSGTVLRTFTKGEKIFPTIPNGYFYEVTNPGSYQGPEPNWPTILGDSITLGSLIFTCRISKLEIYGSPNVYFLTVRNSGNIITHEGDFFTTRTLTFDSKKNVDPDTNTVVPFVFKSGCSIGVGGMTITSGWLVFGETVPTEPASLANKKYVVTNSTSITHTDGKIDFNYELNTTVSEGSVSSNYTLTKGDLSFNNKSVIRSFSSSNSNTRSLTIASNKSLFLTGFYTVWLTNTDPSLTINALGSSIILTQSADYRALDTVFNGGYNINAVIDSATKTVTSYSIINDNIKFGTLEFRKAPSGGTGRNSILGSNKFENIIDGNAAVPQAHTLSIEENQVQVVDNFSVNGLNASNKITLSSCSAANAQTSNLHYLVRSFDLENSITVNYLDIYHSAVTPAASGGSGIWNAKNSVNRTTTLPNYGWNFINVRYWVGGTDTWNATAANKWSSDKGGIGGSTAPTVNDDVIFDDTPAPEWQARTAYTANVSIVSPSSADATGYYYMAVATTGNNKSGDTHPNWPNTYDPDNPSNNQFVDNNVTWETRKATVTFGTVSCMDLTFKGESGENHFIGNIVSASTTTVSVNGTFTLGDEGNLDYTAYLGTFTFTGSSLNNQIFTGGRTVTFGLIFTQAVDNATYTFPEYFVTSPRTRVTINRGVVKFEGVSDVASADNPNVYYNASIGGITTTGTTKRKIIFDDIELTGGVTSNWDSWSSAVFVSGTPSSDTLIISRNNISPSTNLSNIHIGGPISTGYKNVVGNITYAIPANIIFYGRASMVGFCTTASLIKNVYFRIAESSNSTNISLITGSIVVDDLDFGLTYGNWNQTIGGGSITLNKSITLSTIMTYSNPQDLIISNTGTNVCNVTMNGIAYKGGITVSAGVLNFIEENTSIDFFTASGNSNKTINFLDEEVGISTLILTGANANTPTWNFPSTISNLTFNNLNKAIIKFTNETATALIFEGGNRTYGTVWFNRNNSLANGVITIRGNNTFDYLKDGNLYTENGNPITNFTDIPAHTLAFADGSTQYIKKDFLVSGQANKKITLDNVGTGTTNFTLVNQAPNPYVNCYFLTIQNSTVSPYTAPDPNADPPIQEQFFWYANASNVGTGPNIGWQILDDRYWIGGTPDANGYYQWTNTANWALSADGTGPNAGAPTTSSNAYFTSYFSDPVTLNAVANSSQVLNCHDLICSHPVHGNYTGIFRGYLGFRVGFTTLGNIVLSPDLFNASDPLTGSAWYIGGANNSTINLDFNNNQVSLPIFLGRSGNNITYNLKSNLTAINDIKLSGTCIFNTGYIADGVTTSYDIIANTFTTYISTNVTLNLFNSNIYLTGYYNGFGWLPWQIPNTTVTVNAGNSNIVVTPMATGTFRTGVAFEGGGQTYYNLTFLRDRVAKTWTPDTYYIIDDIIVPTTPNGYYYRASDFGKSGNTEPVWNTDVGTNPTTDYTISWICMSSLGNIVNQIAIYGDNTFNNITAIGGKGYNFYFIPDTNPGTITNTVNKLNISGRAGGIVTIANYYGGTRWNIVSSSATDISVCNYVSVVNSDATPPDKFYVGVMSSIVSSTGWGNYVSQGNKELLLLGVGQ
jgi:NADH:ubiquinone oxidoreductase subunit